MPLLVDALRSRNTVDPLHTSHRYFVIGATQHSHRDATRIAETLRASGVLVAVELADAGTGERLMECAYRDERQWLSELCFVVLTHCGALDATRAVRRAHARCPGIPVVAVISLVPEEIQSLKAALIAGADDVLLLGYDDLARSGERIAQRAIVSLSGAAVLAALRLEVTEAGAELLAAVLQPGSGVPTVASLAFALGISHRTLSRRFVEAELPAPALVVTWTRILIASYSAHVVRCSAGALARLVGYPSPRGLREVVRRHAGISLSALRSPATFDRLCGSFILILRERRSRGRT